MPPMPVTQAFVAPATSAGAAAADRPTSGGKRSSRVAPSPSPPSTASGGDDDRRGVLTFRLFSDGASLLPVPHSPPSRLPVFSQNTFNSQAFCSDENKPPSSSFMSSKYMYACQPRQLGLEMSGTVTAVIIANKTTCIKSIPLHVKYMYIMTYMFRH